MLRYRRATIPFTALLLMLTLAACARFLSSPPHDYSAGYANDVFESGFEFVNRRYIDQLDMRSFALAGLESLSEIDPAIRTRAAQAQSLDILVGSAPPISLPLPENGDSDDWARLVTDVVEVARRLSPPLREAEAEQIFQVVYNGALKELDRFSRYSGLEDATDARAMREGFGGIGISIRVEENAATILSVVRGTPADKAGLRANDRVIGVDGELIAGWTQRQLVRQLRGEINTTLRMTIARPAVEAPFQVILERKRIVPTTVEARHEERTGVIRVSSFNQRTAENVRKEVSRLQRDFPRSLDGYVLDLRDNPGGLLDQAVEVADVFLREGEIVRTRGRHPHSRQQYAASGRDYANGLPIVVLINGDSASASEVVAAALQDRGRAVVIGTTSYGKGTVQTVYRLPNNGELTLTWSRLHAPTGYRLHGLGVLPNLCTSDADGRSTTSEVVRELRGGRTATQGVLPEWRRTDTSQENSLEVLRDTCRSAEDSPESDVLTAQAILGEPDLYRQALKPLPPSIAHR